MTTTSGRGTLPGRSEAGSSGAPGVGTLQHASRRPAGALCIEDIDHVVDPGITVHERPVTLFAHGMGGDIRGMRIYAQKVWGTHAFMHFRGHGRTPVPPGPWTYEGTAGELQTVAHEVGATRAVGVSMGAGSILRTLVYRPGMIDRAVLILPAAVDSASDRSGGEQRAGEILEYARAGDMPGLVTRLLQREPAELRHRPVVKSWARRQGELFMGGLAEGLGSLALDTPLADRRALGAVDVPVLVITHEGDEAHPVEAAREIHRALTHSRLVVLPPGSVLWRGRGVIQNLVADFLNADTAPLDD